MHSKSAVAVALLAAATPLVNAQVNIKNSCGFPVYLWTVSNYAGEMKTIDVGDSYSEAYQTNSDGGGISMKLATVPSNGGSITQLEYTLEGDNLWYDVSNINGYPFSKWGFALKPSSSGCRKVVCSAGDSDCSAVYNTPDQNEATAACTSSSALTLSLCGPSGGSAGSAGSDVSDSDNEDIAVQKHHSHHNKHEHAHAHEHAHKHAHKDHKHHNKHHKGGVPSVSVPAVPATSVVPTVVPSVAQGVSGAMTTFVTQVVTITARDAAPTLAARHIHQHAAHHHRS